MENTPVRVRFAPAPTGTMHLGNIRTALMNYLFAQQQQGTFVLRIEDTDTERNYDPGAVQIMQDLAWLGLSYDEGPVKGGPDAPYFQSERDAVYQEKLKALADMHAIYRCFCSPEELEKKRARQVALKIAPRYDRTCLKLTQTDIDHALANQVPFVWRVKLDHDQTVTIHDLARGNVNFELKHFSDFPISRSNGTVTFMFANFVDDMTMRITHVFRGEDHLSNTAGQAALYKLFNAPLPTFWHMPILCNTEGRKLSKRDKCFSIKDLQDDGYLPEALCNYLATLGGSFSEEIMDKKALAAALDFTRLHASGYIKYDVAKLTWLNSKWINAYELHALARLCKPFLIKHYPHAADMSDDTLAALLQVARAEMQTLADVSRVLGFYFAAPTITLTDITACIPQERAQVIAQLVHEHPITQDGTTWAAHIKNAAHQQQIPMKELFWFLRLALMGSVKGFAIAELVDMLGIDESRARIAHTLNLLR